MKQTNSIVWQFSFCAQRSAIHPTESMFSRLLPFLLQQVLPPFVHCYSNLILPLLRMFLFTFTKSLETEQDSSSLAVSLSLFCNICFSQFVLEEGPSSNSSSKVIVFGLQSLMFFRILLLLYIILKCFQSTHVSKSTCKCLLGTMTNNKIN